jgi:hypothetical protein
VSTRGGRERLYDLNASLRCLEELLVHLVVRTTSWQL